MPSFTAAILLVMGAGTAAVASQPVAKMQMPCASTYQVLSPAGTQVAVQCKDHSLHLVDIPEGTQRNVVPSGRGANTFAYSPDGHWLAIGFEDGSVEVTASRDATSVKHWNASPRRVDVLYFFPDAKTLFVGPVDSPGQVWELTGTPVLRATLPVDVGGINACAVTADGKLLAAAGDDTVIRWFDTARWQKTRESQGFLLETFALQFTPDGKYLLAGGADSRITLLDVASGRVARQLPPEPGSYIIEIDLLGDKQRALTVYLDDAGQKPPHALFWDLATGKSERLNFDSAVTCGAVVKGKLWVCSVNGDTLTISQPD